MRQAHHGWMARRTKPQTDPKLAVAYLRVSTDDQALGPKAQQAAISRWAKANGVTVVATCADIGISGGAELDKRPGLVEALRALEQHGAGVLVVAKRDRLARDVMVASAVGRLVEGSGARIASADGAGNATGPEGMLMGGLVDLFAQYERALIRSRTSAALAVKRARGERVGEIPIGFRVREDGQQLVADAAEQAALARVLELRASGFSLRAIAETMNAEGIPARGERWHPTTVARLLERSAA
jgi:DNA invertase Pin-like site-specific DNA recombinase